MLERFTEEARKTIVLAQEEAGRLRHGWLGTEHLLLGLLRQEEGAAADVLGGIDIEEARERVQGYVGHGDEDGPRTVPFTPRAKRVLELALRSTRGFAHERIGTGHLLLGLVGEPDGVGARVLADMGMDPETLRKVVLWISNEERWQGKAPWGGTGGP